MKHALLTGDRSWQILLLDDHMREHDGNGLDEQQKPHDRDQDGASGIDGRRVKGVEAREPEVIDLGPGQAQRDSKEARQEAQAAQPPVEGVEGRLARRRPGGN